MKLKTFSFGISIAYLMLSCNPKEILEPAIDYPAFVVIDGDTVKTRDDKSIKDKFKGHPDNFMYFSTGDTTILYKTFKKNKPSKVANLTNISNPDRKGKKFRLVTFGGSLAAGVRDGGLFNEGMETSFGSLLANQMGVDFKNPLFDAQNYNGMGRKEYTNFNPTKGPIVKYKDVTNNIDVDPIKKEANGNAILKKVALDYDNYSFAYSSFIGRGESKTALTDAENFTPFEKRMNRPNISAQIKEGNTFDFFVMEIPDGFIAPGNAKDFERYLEIKEFDNINPPNLGAGGFFSRHQFYPNFFKKLERIKAKGVILNYYNTQDLPFNNQNYKSDFVKIVNKYQLNKLYTGSGYAANIEEILISDVISGYSAFDSLLSPVVNINIKPGITIHRPVELNYKKSGYNYDDESKILNDNKDLSYFANRLGFPVVDLYSLYKRLKNGSSIMIDGVEVSGKWPGGNFYSNDGQNPSAFGQAIITNEIIKVINSYYKTDISLINTRDFLK
jgi:hypothetical protein